MRGRGRPIRKKAGRVISDVLKRFRGLGPIDLTDHAVRPRPELLAVLDRRFPARPVANENDEVLLGCVLERYGFSPLTSPRGGPSNGFVSPPRRYSDYAAGQLTSGRCLAGLLHAQLQRNIVWCCSTGSILT
jgi:hypothetical protein